MIALREARIGKGMEVIKWEGERGEEEGDGATARELASPVSCWVCGCSVVAWWIGR